MSSPTYGPDQFFSDVTVPDPATVVSERMPRSWSEGGMIEAVKTAVITGLREGFQGTTMKNPGPQEFYISIEYPTATEQYPGIWVQFSIDKLQRAGLGMETWTKVNDEWGAIQEWCFDGRIIITIAALTSKDRDRLSDTVLAQLAFSRPPDLSLRDPSKDALEFRGLIATIEANPYVFMTVNNDIISPGGQTTSNGTPWSENILLYEDSYSLACTGQFNMRFAHDGVYSLAEIRPNPTMLSDTEIDPSVWRGAPGPDRGVPGGR
jgi:hypothetical protein